MHNKLTPTTLTSKLGVAATLGGGAGAAPMALLGTFLLNLSGWQKGERKGIKRKGIKKGIKVQTLSAKTMTSIRRQELVPYRKFLNKKLGDDWKVYIAYPAILKYIDVNGRHRTVGTEELAKLCHEMEEAKILLSNPVRAIRINNNLISHSTHFWS